MLNKMTEIVSKTQSDSISNEECEAKILSSISNDFLGYLKDKPLEIKKIRVLQIYEYLFIRTGSCF